MTWIYERTADPLVALLGAWAGQFSVAAIILRLLLAVVLSGIIGCERYSKRHSAGLRTFILVSLATASAAMLDEALSLSMPILSAAAIIGTAMLSGNSILFSSRSRIKGLTTSAGLWVCGVMGLACGYGFYTGAIIITLLQIAILVYLPAMEAWLNDRSNHFEMHLELKSKENLQDFVTTIRKLGMSVDDIEANAAYVGSGLSVYTVLISISSQELKKYKKHSEIIDALSTLEYVYHVEEMK